MSRKVLRKNLCLIALLSISIQVSGQPDGQKGDLSFYHRATQIGIIAKREFKDDKGRVVKAIYYNAFGIFEGPVSENLLREDSIHKFTYDSYGCVTKSEIYDPRMRLIRTELRQCRNGTSSPRFTIINDANGVKERETRHGSSNTVLYFDHTGKNVVAIGGQMQDDVDLVNGWGKQSSGLALGIAANRDSGPQRGLRVHTSIKAVEHDPERRVSVSPVLAELKDSHGRVFKQREPRQQPETIRMVEGCPDYHMFHMARNTGTAQLYRLYTLDEDFDPLPLGKYSFTVTYCVSNTQQPLISNTIFFEITRKN